MRRRTLATLLALTAVVALVAILPRTPPGRAWILGRLTSALERSGVTVTYRHASGDLWAGVELDGAQVRMPGASLDARNLRIDYFLPSLITGDLPLSVTVSGLRGSVDVGKLSLGGGGGLPIRPRLQELTVSDASVSVQQVPYTIPSGAVSHVRIHQQGGGLQVEAQVSTADGTADVTGTLDVGTPRFDGQVVRADVSLARHWFPGASAGSISGPVHAGPDGVRADLTLEGGALDAIGLRPHGIHGTVQLRYPLVRADLQGTVLGGDVSAHGVVNIAARHWTAHASGDPQLLETASWLARDSLAPGSALPVRGTASTTLDASGWKDIHLSGNANGSGSLAGLPLSDLQLDYSYDSVSGVKAQATGHLAGGAAVVSAVTGPSTTTIQVTARQMRPLPGQAVDLRADLALGPSGPSGSVHAVDQGTVAARPFSLTLDGDLNSDGWQAVLQGKDSQGASLEGAAALAGGRLSGEVRLHDLALPGLLQPLSASLRADGKLTVLPLTLTLDKGTPLRLGAGAERVRADLGGTVAATLAGGKLQRIEGDLGPLQLSGSVTLAPLAGRVNVALAPTAVSGPVAGELALANGQLVLGSGPPSAEGTLHLTGLSAGPVALPDLALAIAPGASGTALLTATTQDQRVHIALGPDRVRAALHDLPLAVAGTGARLDGSIGLPLRHPLAGLSADLSASTDGATLSLQGKSAALSARLGAPAGTAVGPLTLARPLALDGKVDAVAGRGTFQGNLGEVPLNGTLTLHGAAGVAVTAGDGPSPFTLDVNGNGWRARGDLQLGPLARALGVPLQGTLRSDLARGAGGYQGTAQVDTSAPLPARLRLTGTGSTLDAALSSSLLGREVTATGTLRPRLALRAEAGPLGPITLRDGRLTGSGSLPAQALGAGVTLAALDWTLQGSLSPLSVDLALADHGKIHLDAASGLRLAAGLQLPLRFEGQTLALDVATAGSGPPVGVTGAPAVKLNGGLAEVGLEARLAGGSGETLARAHGTPASLAVHGTVPAALLAARLPASLTPAGTLTFDGNARLTGPRRLHLSGAWKAGSASLKGSLTSSPDGTDVSLQGAGLAIDVGPNQASLTADAADLAPFFPDAPVSAVLDGALSRKQGRYGGALKVDAKARSGSHGSARATLSGDGSRLTAHVTGAAGPLALEGDGTLLPVPDLHLGLSAWGGAAVLSADSHGPWTRLALAGTLTTRAVTAQPWLQLPARSMSFHVEPGSGAIAASGDGVRLSGTLADVQGSVQLPLRVLGADERVQARVSGPLVAPRLQAALAGPLTGEVSGSMPHGLGVDLVVDKQALVRLAPLAASRTAGDVTVAGALQASGRWNARVTGALSAGGRTLPVDATLDGNGAAYQGSVTVAAAGGGKGSSPPSGGPASATGGPAGSAAQRLARATLQGSGARAHATLDLANVDYGAIGTLLGVPLQLDAKGALAIATAPLSVSLRIDASGSAAGRPLALHGHATPEDVALDAGFGTLQLHAAGNGTGPVSLALSAPQGDLALRGSLAVGASPDLRLQGTAAGVPASLALAADLAQRSGRLRAAFGKASLRADLSSSGGALALSAKASAPQGALVPLGLPVAGNLAVDASMAHGKASLKRLGLELSGASTPLSASLSGPLYPTAGLTGSISAPAWDVSGGLSLTGPPTGLRASLSLDSLNATAALHGRALVALAADGSARFTPQGHPIAIQAQHLNWVRDQGFGGNASVRLQDPPAAFQGPVDASLSGHGPLQIRSAIGPADAPWARLEARLAADPTGPTAWQGNVRLALPLAAVAGLPGPATLTLTGDPAITGSLLAPALQGPVALAGAATASGQLAWRNGGGKLTLASSSLTLAADLHGTAWHVSAALDGLSLAPFLPAGAPDATASLKAELQGGAGQPLDGNLSALALKLPGAVLTGNATVHDGIRAALQVSADLANMQLPGPALTGLVHGPLVLAAPDLGHLGQGTLIAQLDVAHLGPRGVNAAVDGSLQLGGTPGQPVLSAVLQGTGAAHGQLRADAALAPGRLDLHSTLGYDAFATDLNINLHDGTVQASGQARFGKAQVKISTAPGGELALAGSGALAGWQAAVPASLARASVSGPLASLGAGTQGQLAVTVGGTPWLDGAVKGAVVGGITLGNVSLASTAAGAPIQLTADHLRAHLDPATLDWTATLNGQPLPGGTQASGRANGHALDGSADVALGGRLAGRPVDVRVRASRRPAIAVDAKGTVAGGTLAAHVTRPSGGAWQGTVTLGGATLGGVTASLDGTVTADTGGAPALDASVALHGAVSGNASVHVSPAAARLTARLTGAGLAGTLDAAGSLTPALDLTLSAPAAGGGGSQSLHLYQAGGAMRADGSLQLPAGPARVTLTGGGAAGPVRVGVRVPAVPGLAFQGTLPEQAPRPLVRSVAMHGLALSGSAATTGRLSLQPVPTPHATLDGVSLRLSTLSLSASGSLASDGASLKGALTLPKGLPVDALGGTAVPYALAWSPGNLSLTSDGPTGHIHAELDPASGKGKVTASLHTLGAQPGTATVDVAFDPKGGASGAVKVQGVKVSRPDLPGLTVGADIQLASGIASGSVDVNAPRGGLRASGSWGLADMLPSAFAPTGATGGHAELRVSTFDLASLPTLQRLVPHLAGSASGVVRLRDSTVVGELVVPDLKVADTALPVDVQVSGTLGRLDARAKIGSSVATATLEPGSASGLLQLQSFPAQVLAEAVTGATDVTATVDGVMRFDVPYRHPGAAYLRMATQRVTLERAGVTTTGNASWVYNDHSFTVTDAAFQGHGSWQAKGTIDASTLNFQLSASDADFTPLLGLVPTFAHYGVGASGSFRLDAQGSPSDPVVTLDASGIEARVAGTHYRLENVQAALKGQALTAAAHIVGVAPLGGSVDAKGSAHLTLAPLALSHTDFTFTGSAQLPVVGTVTGLSGGIAQQGGKPPQLDLSGNLGNPFTVRGSLSPFDVTVKGDGLDLQASPLFVTSSTVNADVRVRGTGTGLSIGGELDATEVHMNIGAPSGTGQAAGGSGSSRAPASAPAQGQTQGTPVPAAPSGGGSAPSAGTSRPAGQPAAATPSAQGQQAQGNQSASSDQAAQAARASVTFDHLHLKAPQRVLLAAGFGNAEAALDLTLTGTAAAPKLEGQARALRGTLTFAGRDFTIDKATATFQASRGAYPNLDVTAHTEFDKQRVLGSATDLTFAAPRDGNTFQVTLAFSGQVQPSKQGPSPVRFDIQPTLSSNALVQSTSDTGTSSPRPLSDSELLSLVTLGRLGVTPQLAGQSAFGAAVAQSALDTAVNVLVVSELQNALGKALGLDVVQIQTSPISSLIENSGQPFGVSLRLGGYLSPELFASYRLGNYNGASGAFGFSNEVSLSYDLGPLNFDLSGRLSFPQTTPDLGAVPELGVGIRYAFTNNLGLDAGVDLSDVRKQAHFGVSFNW